MSNKLHQAARGYAKRGMAVFPLSPRSKMPLRGSRGVHDASTDLALIDRWWGEYPEANVAVACGQISNIFVLDIDGGGGEASLAALEAKHGDLPETVEAITGKGRHCYFRCGEHGPIGNSASRIGTGIDIRGDGGYVVAPPSVHPSGRVYAWSVDSASVMAQAPDWLLTLLAEPDTPARTLSAEWHELAATIVEEGCRNQTLTRLCGHLLRHRVNPRLTLALVHAFNVANCRPPLLAPEVEAVFNSIGRAEARRRGLTRG